MSSYQPPFIHTAGGYFFWLTIWLSVLGGTLLLELLVKYAIKKYRAHLAATAQERRRQAAVEEGARQMAN